jgi:hypothetical protein
MKIDLFDPTFLADPYPAYTWLREHSPVHHLGGGMWAVSRYDDIFHVLRNPAVYSSELGFGGMMRGDAMRLPGGDDRRRRALNDTGMGVMMQSFAGLRLLIATDPPDHTRMRRLVSKPFSPRNISALEPRIQQICDSLVDEMLNAREGDVADLWAHISYPLPTMVIAEVLGIPAERRADFKRWSDAVVNGLSLSGEGDVGQGVSGALEMFQYFDEVVADRRATPRDDLISRIIHGSDESDEPLSTQELVAFCVLLLIAGDCATIPGSSSRPSRRRCGTTPRCRASGGASANRPSWAASSWPRTTASWCCSRPRTGTSRTLAPTPTSFVRHATRSTRSRSGSASTSASVRPSLGWRRAWRSARCWPARSASRGQVSRCGP